MKRNIITIILALAAMTASAQGLVFGRVQDAFLKTPITDAKVSLLLAAAGVLIMPPVSAKVQVETTHNSLLLKKNVWPML